MLHELEEIKELTTKEVNIEMNQMELKLFFKIKGIEGATLKEDPILAYSCKHVDKHQPHTLKCLIVTYIALPHRA